MTAKFEDSRKYNLGKSQLIENVKTALKKCKFRIKHIDEDGGLIRAKSRLSFWSWTEKIDVKIEDNGTVRMKSECSLPTQIIDWGKNKRNVRKFFSYLG